MIVFESIRACGRVTIRALEAFSKLMNKVSKQKRK